MRMNKDLRKNIVQFYYIVQLNYRRNLNGNLNLSDPALKHRDAKFTKFRTI